MLCEGDPLFYGSYMHLHVRLAPRFPTEVIPGVTAMSGCWSPAGVPIAQGDDVLTVLPAHAAGGRADAAPADTDAAVVMKLGRNLPKIRRALAAPGRLPRAIYVERGTMAGHASSMPLPTSPTTTAPYFAIVLVPGWAAGHGRDRA